jgi:hypothetical protein
VLATRLRLRLVNGFVEQMFRVGQTPSRLVHGRFSLVQFVKRRVKTRVLDAGHIELVIGLAFEFDCVIDLSVKFAEMPHRVINGRIGGTHMSNGLFNQPCRSGGAWQD